MKNFLIKLFLVNLIGIFSLSPVCLAAVNLPWETTFNCPESNQTDWFNANPYSVNCDGLGVYGGWCAGPDEPPCTPPKMGEQITQEANYSGGGGGRGQRHWKGDDVNDCSGGLSLTLSQQTPELWMRWYMRYPEGLKWSNLISEKWFHFDLSTQNHIWEFHYYRVGIFASYAGGNDYESSVDKGWQYIMNGSTGDGRWHCYEGHIKMDTNSSDGIAQFWVDGELLVNNKTADLGTKGGWQQILMGSNNNKLDNGKFVPIDFDDFKIVDSSYTGWQYDAQGNEMIGPITSFSDITPPAAPSGVSVS